MTILCNNCDMNLTARSAPGWHGVRRVRTAKEAATVTTLPMETWTNERGELSVTIPHEDFDNWWTHEGWCPECVAENKCECDSCRPHPPSQKTLFTETA